MPTGSTPITSLRLLNVDSGRRPIIKFSNYTPVYLFWFMYQSVNANFNDMGEHVEFRARDLHFFNVTWQAVDVSKARKIAMKSEIV